MSKASVTREKTWMRAQCLTLCFSSQLPCACVGGWMGARVDRWCV